MEQAFEQQHWEKLAFEAHSLKGSAGSMDFPMITELAAELEQLAHQHVVQRCEELLLQMRSIAEKGVTNV